MLLVESGWWVSGVGDQYTTKKFQISSGVADCVDKESLICLSVCARACARVCSCQAAGLAGPPVLMWADVWRKSLPRKEIM